LLNVAFGCLIKFFCTRKISRRTGTPARFAGLCKHSTAIFQTGETLRPVLIETIRRKRLGLVAAKLHEDASGKLA
jgi:hypothetical protein